MWQLSADEISPWATYKEERTHFFHQSSTSFKAKKNEWTSIKSVKYKSRKQSFSFSNKFSSFVGKQTPINLICLPQRKFVNPQEYGKQQKPFFKEVIENVKGRKMRKHRQYTLNFFKRGQKKEKIRSSCLRAKTKVKTEPIF